MTQPHLLRHTSGHLYSTNTLFTRDLITVSFRQFLEHIDHLAGISALSSTRRHVPHTHVDDPFDSRRERRRFALPGDDDFGRAKILMVPELPWKYAINNLSEFLRVGTAAGKEKEFIGLPVVCCKIDALGTGALRGFRPVLTTSTRSRPAGTSEMPLSAMLISMI